MSSRDGLWKPDLPEFLADQDAVELLFVKSLREPEPMTTPAVNGISQIAAALVKARADIEAIGKDRVNPHFGKSYATLDAVIAEVIPKLAAHGLMIVQGCVVPISDEHGKVTAFTVRTTLLHVSGESLDRDIVMPLDKSDPQGAGRSITYGRRYGLSALLCLATEDDDDGNSASRGAKQQRTERKPNGAPPIQPAVATAKGPADRMVKGVRLGDMKTPRLVEVLEWARTLTDAKAKDLVADCEYVLDERSLAAENEAVGA